MPSDVLLHVILASIPLAAGLAITWRLVWPRWKLPGKIVAFLGTIVLLSLIIGPWSVVLGWLHQGFGIALHVRFCRKHAFTWYKVQDVDRYIALGMASVGYHRRRRGRPS